MSEEYDKKIDISGRSTDNDFIIYSNDYTSNELNLELKKISINENILEQLLRAGAKLFTQNLENKMPIFKILNSYNYKILNKLCGPKSSNNFGIRYNYIGSMNYNNPVDYIKKSIKNHSDKLLGNNLSSYNQIKGFSYNVYQQIRLVMLDEKFGYNILKNIDTSFMVSSYIINQYLVSIYYQLNKGLRSVNNQYGLLEKDYSEIPVDNTNLAIKTLRTEIENYKADIISKLNNGTTSQKESKLLEEYKLLEDLLGKIPETSYNFKTHDKPSINNFDDIVGAYSFQDYNKYNCYLDVWKSFLKNNTYDDYSYELIKRVNDLEKNIQNLDNIDKNIVNQSKSDINDDINVFESISNFCEEYFKEHRFTEVNETLFFINRLLVFLTKYTICTGVESFTRKTFAAVASVTLLSLIKMASSKP